MKLLSIRPEGGKEMRSVHVASVMYENADGKKKRVPIFSRHRIETEDDLRRTGFTEHATSVQAIVVNDEGKILVTKEFRLGVNAFVFGFPTGLPDKNELPADTAMREVKEETGISAEPVYQSHPGFTNPAETNESMVTVIGMTHDTAKDIQPSDSVNEEVYAEFYSMEELQKLCGLGVFMTTNLQHFAEFPPQVELLIKAREENEK